MQVRSARVAGITLLEAAVATAIVALAIAIAYPPVSAGVETARLHSAVDQARLFLLDTQQFADRHRRAVLLRIDPGSSRIESYSEGGSAERVLHLPGEFRIAAPAEVFEAIVLPGAVLPEVHLVLASRRGTRAGLRVDLSTGTLEALGDGG